MQNKSTVQEITSRFDNDVERFSNLQTGQVSTLDAQLSLELITEAAKRLVPHAVNLLDIGCGAGNYTLKMLGKLPDLNCTLVDLSKPMLHRALQRVSSLTERAEVIQGDIRTVDLPEQQFDIILAGAVLHHLRDDSDWELTFKKLYNLLKPGGCLMISDLILQNTAELNTLIWDKYGDYLEAIGGQDYKNKVLDYIAKEDSPRSIIYQLELMTSVGFSNVDILHKNLCFAAYGGVK
ncbi:class I SAM-dependent methyltransferase [Formosa sp. A9]|uniref:class I SAM-dependent methyltransferase n=1 Tax=Formosa sp. A9 TaxID=3442641 RepID=UPI003EBDF150